MPLVRINSMASPNIMRTLHRSDGNVIKIGASASPNIMRTLHRSDGNVIKIGASVGRNILRGLHRIDPPGGATSDYILQETGFRIDLEDGSGGILIEN